MMFNKPLYTAVAIGAVIAGHNNRYNVHASSSVRSISDGQQRFNGAEVGESTNPTGSTILTRSD